MRTILLVAAAIGTTPLFAADALPVDWGRERKKVVAFGWEWKTMSPERLLEYADQIDASGIDGISIYVKASGNDGKVRSSASIIDGDEFTFAMLADQVETLRMATSHKGLRESFIRTLGAPKVRVDWKDDAHWARVARSMGALARFAKKSGVRGFIVDPEDYHKQNQFEARAKDEPYDLLAPLARKRAREIFSSVFREYPEIVVLGYWLFSWHPQHVNSENPMMSARSAGDLWPAFINGILDVMPPEAMLVDGDEWVYDAEASKNEFMVSATAQRNAALGLVAPENRAKFRAQAMTGFGLYLDSYVTAQTNKNGKANQFYFGPENGSRRGHFERNLSEALESAGKYVWLWCEKKSWVKWRADVAMGWGVDRRTWEECLPGLSRTLRACADHETFLLKDYPELLAEGKILNIATNDYVAASYEAIRGKHDKKDASTKGPGYFHVCDTTALPGQHYVVDVSGSGEGLSAVAFWQRRKDGGFWRWRIPGHGLAFEKRPGGRYGAKALVRVPEGVDCLAIQFRLNPSPGKECVFDRIFVGRVTY